MLCVCVEKSSACMRHYSYNFDPVHIYHAHDYTDGSL